MRSEGEPEYSLTGLTVQNRFALSLQDINQVKRAIDKAIVPLDTFNGDGDCHAVPKHHQFRQIYRACCTTIYK